MRSLESPPLRLPRRHRERFPVRVHALGEPGWESQRGGIVSGLAGASPGSVAAARRRQPRKQTTLARRVLRGSGARQRLHRGRGGRVHPRSHRFGRARRAIAHHTWNRRESTRRGGFRRRRGGGRGRRRLLAVHHRVLRLAPGAARFFAAPVALALDAWDSTSNSLSDASDSTSNSPPLSSSSSSSAASSSKSSSLSLSTTFRFPAAFWRARARRDGARRRRRRRRRRDAR